MPAVNAAGVSPILERFLSPRWLLRAEKVRDRCARTHLKSISGLALPRTPDAMAETADDGVYIREATREQVKTRKKAIKDRLKKSEGVSWADFEILTLLGHGAFGKVRIGA